MTKISLLCSIYFQCLKNLGYMAKIFLHALVILEKYNMIIFLTLEGLQKNGVDGQLLHAIKAFYGADWSFAVEYMASNQSFPYRH